MIIDPEGLRTWRTILPAAVGVCAILLFLMIALVGCTGCNQIAPGKDQVCGPYSSFFWLPD